MTCTARLGESAQRRVAYLTDKWTDYRVTGEIKFQFAGFVDDGIDQFARALEESTRQYLDHLKRAAGGNRRNQTTSDARPPVPVKPFTPAEQDMYWTVIRWKNSLPLHIQEYEQWRREYETAKIEERRGRTAWGNKKRTRTAVSKIQQRDEPSNAGPSHRMKRKRTLDRATTLDSVHSAPPTAVNEPAHSSTLTNEAVAHGQVNQTLSARRYGSAPVGMDAATTVDSNNDDSRPPKKRRRAADGLRVVVHDSNHVDRDIVSAATEDLDQDMDARASTGVSAYFEKVANEATVTEHTIQHVQIDQPLSTAASPLHTPTCTRRTKDLAVSRGTPLSAAKKYGSIPGIDSRSGSQRLGFTASKSSLTSSCSSNADLVSSKRGKSKIKGKGRGRGGERENEDVARAATVTDDDEVFAERRERGPGSPMKEDVSLTNR
ncbi:hypothetical protein QFC22_001614 [Naganishia vaughanmartiniae]|uniref:Uncharacterized protein n=1 Tax=Naganishia vaughanmartiniae TaxID=1424756 RepID=A0ACC2XHJ9_9TREE|nr:hypothetical protein QFC22_001614 [Naganishia vaughanmartiniae]